MGGEEVPAAQHLLPAVASLPSVPACLIEHVVAACQFRRTASRIAREGGQDLLPDTSEKMTGIPRRDSERATASTTCGTALKTRTGRAMGPIIDRTAEEFTILKEARQELAVANVSNGVPVWAGDKVLHL